MSMESSVDAVEKIVGYSFRNKALLEEALTHSSYTQAPSYERLEFVGDAALGLAVAKFLYDKYPDLGPGHLTFLREANVDTEKLARVAVRHDLFRYVRRNTPSLDLKVDEFAQAVSEKGDEIRRSGSVKAPKVLADIVESIAAAVYFDCKFDAKKLWNHFKHLLEPIVTLETLQRHPVQILNELCQKQGKDCKYGEATNITNVFVDGKLVGSGNSDQKDIAKKNAAAEALENLCKSMEKVYTVDNESNDLMNGDEIDGAKQKLYEYCNKNRLRNPTYSTEKVSGPAHDRRFICSVHIETKEGQYVIEGNMRQTKKDAENSAASNMLYGLKNPTLAVVPVP